MNYKEYKQLFDEILNNTEASAPYDNPEYLDYAKLNRSRMKRWDMQELTDEILLERLRQVSKPQHWIIITEPWCGDAAHIVPFLAKMTEQNENIRCDIQLRDSEPFLIEKYLTNGGKSIPKLVIRDDSENDLVVWGPRPAGAQKLMVELKEAKIDFDTIKTALQNWYNEDKGVTICKELSEALSTTL